MIEMNMYSIRHLLALNYRIPAENIKSYLLFSIKNDENGDASNIWPFFLEKMPKKGEFNCGRSNDYSLA